MILPQYYLRCLAHVVHCASGYRSSVAASLVRQHGISDVADLVGGIAAWKASHLPTLFGTS